MLCSNSDFPGQIQVSLSFPNTFKDMFLSKYGVLRIQQKLGWFLQKINLVVILGTIGTTRIMKRRCFITILFQEKSLNILIRTQTVLTMSILQNFYTITIVLVKYKS